MRYNEIKTSISKIHKSRNQIPKKSFSYIGSETKQLLWIKTNREVKYYRQNMPLHCCYSGLLLSFGCFFDIISSIVLCYTKYSILEHKKSQRINIEMAIVKKEESLITCMSEVHKVRLSRSSCMIKVLSLYESSPSVSSSEMASSKAYYV